MKAIDVMQKEVKTCRPEDTLDAVAMTMWEGDCGAVPVIDEAGMPVGIVTDRDIAMASYLNHKPLWELRVKEVTNGRPLYTCKESEKVKVVLNEMRAHRIRRLPVVDGDGRLQGIISIDDMVALSRDDKSAMSTRGTMKVLKAVSIHH